MDNIENIQPFTERDIRVAVDTIKSAIVQSQARAARMVVGEQLSLYFGVGLYVSEQAKHYAWGSGALRQISDQLHREMPGIRGFSEESLKKMRRFAEFWKHYLIGSPTATEMQSADIQSVVVFDNFDLANWSPLASEISIVKSFWASVSLITWKSCTRRKTFARC